MKSAPPLQSILFDPQVFQRGIHAVHQALQHRTGRRRFGAHRYIGIIQPDVAHLVILHLAQALGSSVAVHLLRGFGSQLAP